MKWIAYTLILVLFIGCAAKELVVRNADTMLEYQVNKRLPLRERQKENLSKDIDAFLNTEKTVAQDLIPLVDQLSVDKPEQIEAPFNKLIEFYRKLSKDFSSLLAKYMVQMDKDQQRKFFANMVDENETFAKKTQKQRREDSQDKIERFIGDLTDEQIVILKSYDSFYTQNYKERLTRRIALHEKFKEILAGPGTDTEKQSALLAANNSHQDENFEGNKVLEIIRRFLPTLTKIQKEKFREKAGEVKEILRYYIQVNY